MRKKSKVTKDITGLVMKRITDLAKKQVLVGVPSTKTERKDGDKASNALIAYVMENGALIPTPSGVVEIPARPFLVPGVATAQSEVIDKAEQTLVAVFKRPDKRGEFLDRGLNAMGIVAVSAVRRYMTTADFEPLSEATIEGRRRRGKKSEKPLIDTGQLRASITYILRKV